MQRVWLKLLCKAIWFNYENLIIHDNPSKHCSNSNYILRWHLQSCVIVLKITGVYMLLHLKQSCAKQQICAIIFVMCKYSSKKPICLHIWTICKWPSNPWLPSIFAPRCKCCANVAFTVIATDSKSSAISVFALAQIWAKLCKCGICHTFAVIWLP